jgi:23S rRNA pseudouridine2605 synthase
MKADTPQSLVRLQRYLSDAGISSRRRAEELILEGRVLVNGNLVDTLPAFIDPAKDRVTVDGDWVRLQKLDYWIMHKPKGVVCTNVDPSGRPRAIDLLPELPVRLFPVGRLDADSSGLLLLTNDGELAQRMMHPSFEVPKVYLVEVKGRVPSSIVQQLREGVYLDFGRARASDVEVEHAGERRSMLLVTLREGRNRQVRRMLAKLGFPVIKLKRVQIGKITIRGLPVGACRRLTPRELFTLKQYLDDDPRTRDEAPVERRRPRPRRDADRPRGDADQPPRAGDRPRRPARGAPRPAAGRGDQTSRPERAARGERDSRPRSAGDPVRRPVKGDADKKPRRRVIR